MSNPARGKEVRSTFGPQFYSRRRSPPAYGFGCSSREVANKVYLVEGGPGGHLETKEINRLAPPSQPGPGPVYMMRPAVGPQVNGAIRSQPKWSFSTADRFQRNTGQAVIPGLSSPGPAAYSLGNGLGPQVNAAIKSQPVYGFGTATRKNVERVFISKGHFKSLYGTQSPGPCYLLSRHVLDMAYREPPSWAFGSAVRMKQSKLEPHSPPFVMVAPAIGPQVNSRLPSAPMPGFGTSSRATRAKVYIEEAKEQLYGVHSPGPAAYNTAKVGAAARPMTPSWGFGTGSRWGWHSEKVVTIGHATPGPGAYSV